MASAQDDILRLSVFSQAQIFEENFAPLGPCVVVDAVGSYVFHPLLVDHILTPLSGKSSARQSYI
jgi:hypothetical protein